MTKTRTSCGWPGINQQMIAYHDTEWGVPLHDDNRLFEYLVLDAFQAGLSWAIVLKKRENFRAAFENYDIEKIARYTPRQVRRLLADPGIIRNRLKIEAAIQNARSFLKIQEEFSSFDRYIWNFVGYAPKVNKWKTLKQIPAGTKESDAMSEDLKARGFRFVGTTICYSFMQAAGLVNDHLATCFRYDEINRLVRS